MRVISFESKPIRPRVINETSLAKMVSVYAMQIAALKSQVLRIQGCAANIIKARIKYLEALHRIYNAALSHTHYGGFENDRGQCELIHGYGIRCNVGYAENNGCAPIIVVMGEHSVTSVHSDSCNNDASKHDVCLNAANGISDVVRAIFTHNMGEMDSAMRGFDAVPYDDVIACVAMCGNFSENHAHTRYRELCMCPVNAHEDLRKRQSAELDVESKRINKYIDAIRDMGFTRAALGDIARAALRNPAGTPKERTHRYPNGLIVIESIGNHHIYFSRDEVVVSIGDRSITYRMQYDSIIAWHPSFKMIYIPCKPNVDNTEELVRTMLRYPTTKDGSVNRSYECFVACDRDTFRFDGSFARFGNFAMNYVGDLPIIHVGSMYLTLDDNRYYIHHGVMYSHDMLTISYLPNNVTNGVDLQRMRTIWTYRNNRMRVYSLLLQLMDEAPFDNMYEIASDYLRGNVSPHINNSTLPPLLRVLLICWYYEHG